MILLDKDIKSLISKLEILTKKNISGPLAGDWISKKRGSGFEFEQLRDYQIGDDLRFIDWKSSAKAGKILVREYRQDKNRSVYIFEDISKSMDFSSDELSKGEIAKQIATILMFTGLHAKDAVGLGLFTDEVEKFYPAKQGRKYTLELINSLFKFTPKDKASSLDEVFKYLAGRNLRNSLVCILSDFLTDFNEGLAAIAAKKNDIIAIRLLDKAELQLPNFGFIEFEDIESGDKQLVKLDKDRLNNRLSLWHSNQKKILAKVGIDLLDIEIGKPYFTDLLKFLRYRSIKTG